MAKMLANVKFTAAEKRDLTAARHALDTIAARCGSSAHLLLTETYHAETTGSHSVSRDVAIGLISEWFMRHYNTTALPRDMIGTRSMKLACIADYARHYDKARAPELEAIRAAAAAKNAAVERSMA